MRRLLPIFAGLFGLLAVSAGTGSGAQSSGPTGDIAYLATKAKIYFIDAEGTTPRQLLLSGSSMETFNWSPDARFIAFSAGPWVGGGQLVQSKIRISRADGTLFRSLPLGPLTSAEAPTWSPDGTQLAFTGFNRSADTLGIYVIKADGTGLRRLTRTGIGRLADEMADWSPDGQWIAFERYDWSGGSSSLDVMAVHPNGTGLHRIARVITGRQCACADWSPDGSKLAYQASPAVSSSKYPEIYVMNADGSGRTQLTFTGNRVRDENPDWSPDGKWISFYSERVGNAEIYVIGADGKHLKRVTHDREYVMYPRWRPTS